MIVLFLICFIVIWIIVCWHMQVRCNRLCNIKNNTQVINLGSTYAYYDFDYSECDIVGSNMANIPQYLDMDSLILYKCKKYLKKGAYVIFPLPDFVFASKDTLVKRKVYYEYFNASEISNFSFKFLLKLIIKASIEPIVHNYEKQAKRWEGHKASFEEKERHADNRIKDWEGVLGIPSVQSGEITLELSNNIEKNIILLEKMIDFCKSNDLNPILLIPPVSEIMKRKISEECLNTYLINPIDRVVKSKDVKMLDYSKNKLWESELLYLNSDCLNEMARIEFTKKVLSDIGLV